MSTVLAGACWNTEPALWLAMDLLHWLWLFMTLKISLRISTSWKWTTLRKQCATCSNTPRFSSCPLFSQAPWEYLQRWSPASGVPKNLCSLFMVEVSLGDFLDFEHQHFPFLRHIASWCGILHTNHGKFHFIIVKSLLT